MGFRKEVGVRLANRDREGERGVALLTVMIVMLLMVVLAISAITVTGLETRMSGFVSTKEAMATAAESCEGTAVNIIQQTLYYSEIQPQFLSTATPRDRFQHPIVPPSTARFLVNHSPSCGCEHNWRKLRGQCRLCAESDHHEHSRVTVNGDIDRLFKRRKEGAGSSKRLSIASPVSLPTQRRERRAQSRPCTAAPSAKPA